MMPSTVSGTSDFPNLERVTSANVVDVARDKSHHGDKTLVKDVAPKGDVVTTEE
jgi:hypothetical protein